MRTAITMIVVAVITVLPCTSHAQKSALDHVQFDGVSTDGELKVEHHTRRQWLENHPVQARDYWDAWDCKGKPCDSTWKANIRKNAALIVRTEKDPPAQTGPVGKPQD